MIRFEDCTIEGVDHINIFSKSTLEIGRALSNFALTPFTYEPYGDFQSAEGFYFWYCTGQKHHELKFMHGAEAKKTGSKYRKDRIDVVGMNDELLEVLEGMLVAKVSCNPWIQDLLIKSELPFIHYYQYGDIRTEVSGYDWICPTYTKIREVLKE